MSKKYYRLLKDHPCWEKGAILVSTDNDTYEPIENVWTKEDIWEGYSDGASLVENNQLWYQRVYPIGKLEKMMFGSKKQAQAAAAALYKEDK